MRTPMYPSRERRTLPRMFSRPIYRPPPPGLEARSRLMSLLSVCEHELASLEGLGDGGLTRIIEYLHAFREELLLALAAFPAPSDAPD